MKQLFGLLLVLAIAGAVVYFFFPELISGVPTTIYLTMGGTFWSRKSALEHVRIGGFEPLPVYAEQFVEAGGTLMVCSPCNDFYCSISEGGLIEGAEITGLAAIVDMAMNATTVTL